MFAMLAEKIAPVGFRFIEFPKYSHSKIFLRSDSESFPAERLASGRADIQPLVICTLSICILYFVFCNLYFVFCILYFARGRADIQPPSVISSHEEEPENNRMQLPEEQKQKKVARRTQNATE